MRKTKKTTVRRSSRSAASSGRRHTISRRRQSVPKNIRLSGVSRLERRIFGMKIWHLGSITIMLAAVVLAIVFLGLQPAEKGSADNGCTVSATLVNSCRPWLGATSANYTAAASDTQSQILYHETRIGRNVDVVHTYHAPSHNALTSTDTYFATRANTMLFANWKPGNSGDSWATIASGSDDSEITAMANSIKALGSTKIFLTVWHEPENDVSTGGDSKCTGITYKGSEGSVTDYVNMWHHVRAIFNADGVSNVVWAVDYMNYPSWDCLVPDLYPGDSYVDWVVFNGYQQSNGVTFENTIKRFTNLLTADSIGTTKPWGIVEWGVSKWSGQTSAQSLANEEAYYDSTKAALDGDDSTMAKIKLYMIFDENDQGASGCSATNERVGYDDDCNVSSAKQAHYTAFADDARLTNAYYAPPADTTAPTVSLTSPASGATETGTVSMSGTASDNVGVTSVSFYLDGTKIATDTTSPYNFSFNPSSYSEGAHTLQLKADDAAGNTGSSSVVSVTFHNAVTNPDPGTGSGGSSGGSGGGTTTTTTGDGTTTTTLDAGKTTDDPVAVKGTLVIAPSSDDASLSVKVDGKAMSGNSVNTTKLTNGTHTVTIIENGKAVQQKIVVHNSLPTAIANEIQAHKVAYTAGTSTTLIIIAGLVWLFRRKISFWLLRHVRLRYLKWFGLSEILKLGVRR